MAKVKCVKSFMEEIRQRLEKLSPLHTKKSIDEMIEFICWLRGKL